MNNVYFLLKMNRLIQNPHLKNFGIYMLHLLGKRYLGLFIDPVMGCNLRCKMCYFSDPEKRATMKGVMKVEELQPLANSLFHRALKMQIGCGAEPALFAHNRKLIQLGKQKKIPYISLTTNGALFSEQQWAELVHEGLDEITLSLHGVTKQSYEYLMQGASFETFLNTLQILTTLKESNPRLKIRINYTINKDNVAELADFFTLFESYSIDILQLRPIQKMGNTAYQEFSWQAITDQYDQTIALLQTQCKMRNITCLAPSKEDLKENSTQKSSLVESTYCYLSPTYTWQSDFNPQTNTYETYCKRTQYGKTLFKNIFKPKRGGKNNLNYRVS